MTAAPLAPYVPPVEPAAGHHPLAHCEICGRPVDHPLADCDQDECRRRADELYRRRTP